MNQLAGGGYTVEKCKIRKTKRKVCKLKAEPERKSYIRKRFYI